MKKEELKVGKYVIENELDWVCEVLDVEDVFLGLVQLQPLDKSYIIYREAHNLKPATEKDVLMALMK